MDTLLEMERARLAVFYRILKKVYVPKPIGDATFMFVRDIVLASKTQHVWGVGWHADSVSKLVAIHLADEGDQETHVIYESAGGVCVILKKQEGRIQVYPFGYQETNHTMMTRKDAIHIIHGVVGPSGSVMIGSRMAVKHLDEMQGRLIIVLGDSDDHTKLPTIRGNPTKFTTIREENDESMD